MEIDGCGVEVPAGERAYLSRDLDCRGGDGEGLVMGHRSRLELAGFGIVGGGGEGRQGVRCKSGTLCTVNGPGFIEGFSASGIAGTRVRVRGVAIRGNGVAGIAAYGRVRLRDSVVADNSSMGILTGRGLHALRSSVSQHPDGSVVKVPSALPRRCRSMAGG